MLDIINKTVWGTPLLLLLLGTGLLFSARLGFFQLRHFPYILKNTFITLFKRNEKNGTSQLRAVSTSLAAAMGTGNIVGVATALTIGGAGAIFWMWVSAILGMALVYAENYLAVTFGKGGAMAYLGSIFDRRIPAVLFAACCALAAFGMGNMTQSNAISSALSAELDIPVIGTGIVVALICAAVISGGAGRIGSVTGVMIPLLSVVYFAAALSVILCNADKLAGAFSDIISGAFGLRQAGGGISGALIGRAVSVGLRRGVFSNEAGLGSSAVLHSSSECNDPQLQGMWAVFEVFLDTIVCCTLTALVILSSGAMESGMTGTELVTKAFSGSLGGVAEGFVTAAIVFFAFATIIGWYYCGECGAVYIFGDRAKPFYRAVFIILTAVGAMAELENIWTLSDIFNGLMAFPNLIGLLILRKNVRFDKYKK